MTTTYTVINGEIVSENRGGVKRDYIPDSQGSTRALIDDTQTITDTWNYWPYGDVASKSGSSTTPFTWVGTLGYFTSTLNLIYIRQRFVSPTICAWLTADLIWPDTAPYTYADGSPCTKTDPTGLLSSSIIFDFRDVGIRTLPDPTGLGGRFLRCRNCLNRLYKEIGSQIGAHNSMRHCVGACEAVKQCGSSCARYIIFHEIGSFDTEDSRVDRCNNEIGFAVAESGKDCESACRCLSKAGKLCTVGGSTKPRPRPRPRPRPMPIQPAEIVPRPKPENGGCGIPPAGCFFKAGCQLVCN